MSREHKKWIMKLRLCFLAGYSMPQYCEQHGYTRPLFVGYDEDFMYELHAQFCFYKRIRAEFRVLSEASWVWYDAPYYNIPRLELTHQESYVSQDEFDNFDVIFVLTPNRLDSLFPREKTIYIDTLLDEMRAYVYWIRPVLEYHKSRSDVTIVFFEKPRMNFSGELTAEERFTAKFEVGQVVEMVREGIDPKHFTYGRLGYSADEMIRLYATEAELNGDGSTRLVDKQDELLSVIGGYRKTAYQDGRTYAHRLWCIGDCLLFGQSAPYDKTFESYLQRRLNASKTGENYQVVNASQFFGFRYQDIFYNLQKLPVESGDIILIDTQGMKRDEAFPTFSALHLFDRPHEYGEVFLDSWHINERGLKVVAEEFGEWIEANGFFEGWRYPEYPFAPIHYYGIPETMRCDKPPKNGTGAEDTGLKKYKNRLRTVKPRIGAIVMNCNPFTNGHLHLVKYAAERCDRLYLFVVEEDLSLFSFADRFEMVKKGVDSMDNVTVLPSGEYILSVTTFEGYFNKQSIQGKKVDPSYDVELFAREIAPELGISIRFVGEEPNDSITKQYNESMRSILPRFGIEFCEIPRMKAGQTIISASEVRKLMDRKDFKQIERLVPESTYRYVVEYANRKR